MDNQNDDLNQTTKENDEDPDEPGQSQVRELRSQVEILTNNWKRAVADYQNLEKRITREREDWSRISNLIIFSKLLSILDNLERAQAHLADEGLTIVLNDLKSLLAEEGLQEIIVREGDRFDPRVHECLETVAGEGEGQRVVELVARGYIMGERVVRPARVKVTKATQDVKPNDF